jgi:hypothetical protein
MRSAVGEIVRHSNQNSVQSIAIISSGHGSGDGTGNSFLCTYEGDKYTDKDLALDLRPCVCQKIVILDHCFSGGFCEEMAELTNAFLATASTENGFGYDVPQYLNGMFTYRWMKTFSEFPEHFLLLDLYKKVKEQYTEEATNDRPEVICTMPSISF